MVCDYMSSGEFESCVKANTLACVDYKTNLDSFYDLEQPRVMHGGCICKRSLNSCFLHRCHLFFCVPDKCVP